ncbi:MAG: hypothetical protein KF778_19680 [Rhodocyclaceae bacterium]|nr:hypothetical protein [Rhodocyclaceae bacterium]MBX3670628.1 hypothetical protein [Rhodocyclaceae bacterium]
MAARVFLLLAAALVLCACESDSASYMIDRRDHALTVLRDKNFPWSSTYDTALVVARMPDCQRRYPLKPVPLKSGVVVVYPGAQENSFWVNQGNNWYAVSTADCSLKAAPAQAEVPAPLGSFARKDGKLRFVAKSAAE